MQASTSTASSLDQALARSQVLTAQSLRLAQRHTCWQSRLPDRRGNRRHAQLQAVLQTSRPLVPAGKPGAKARRPHKLPKPRRQLNWDEWEDLLIERLLAKQREAAAQAPNQAAADEWYLSAWGNPVMQQALLEDQVRYSAYREAIFGNEDLLKDKVVLDIGCGIGLLSMMCAQAGARHVYGVEASPAADIATKVVAANGLSGRVSIIRGRAEDVSLPVTKVDVIVCDWMGPFLLHESLLPALAKARDRWLAPGGIILPDRATLFVTGVDDREHLSEQKAFWGRKRYGFDLSAALGAVVRHPRLDTVARRSALVTDTVQLLTLDMYQASVQDLSFKKPFKLTAQRPDRVSGLLAHFDAEFSCRGQAADPVVLTTHPLAPATNWVQTVFSFPRAIKMEQGSSLVGTLSCKPVGAGPPGRMLDVDTEVSHMGMAARVGYQLRRGMAGRTE